MFFWFDLFLEARAEILTKILLVFLGDLKTPKAHFEIKLPLIPDSDGPGAQWVANCYKRNMITDRKNI